MIDEVALAGLVFGEPVKDVKLGVVGSGMGCRRLLWRRRRRGEGRGRERRFTCLLELGRCGIWRGLKGVILKDRLGVFGEEVVGRKLGTVAMGVVGEAIGHLYQSQSVQPSDR